ncbi:DNA-protecting protein DprA [Candidatus Gottesmanbacteria bacterium]|nr:DNA-protecting protein DprA [Candidatus Gottesmanbacteria bacterium]
MTEDERKYWVAFSVFPGVGPVRFRLLREYFGSVKSAWNAPERELRAVKLPEKLVSEFIAFRKKFDIDAYLRQLSTLHVSALTLEDAKYPELLKQISDAPFLLYVKGLHNSKPIDLTRTIGVVGTRKITHYGEDVTKRLVAGLVANGFTIVSGMAYGVDAVAHQTAIDCGGKTIAVLGCGIDIIAPPSNDRLYHEIAEEGHGAIVSEMPLALRPNKGLFPARNRIISGLSLGVLVTEGADDSGALITARNAGEQGRDMFAVPGSIASPYSKGPLKLIKNGAKLVEDVQDILDELGIPSHRDSSIRASHATISYKAQSADEQKIIDVLLQEERHIDEIVRLTGIPISQVFSLMTMLELNGAIKEVGEKRYGIVRPA